MRDHTRKLAQTRNRVGSTIKSLEETQKEIKDNLIRLRSILNETQGYDYDDVVEFRLPVGILRDMSDRMLRKLTDRREEIGPEIQEAKETWGQLDERLEKEITKELKTKGISPAEIEFIHDFITGGKQ
jgi:hypothetical protein